MENLLEKHQRKDILFQQDDIILYNPTNEQLNIIKGFLEENIQIKGNEFNSKVGNKEIRYMIRELTNIGSFIDEYNDKQLLQLLENGDRTIILLIREIEKILNTIMEDIVYETERIINFINSYLNILNSKNNEEKMVQKIEKLLKKYKIDIPVEKLLEIKDNPEKIKEFIGNK